MNKAEIDAYNRAIDEQRPRWEERAVRRERRSLIRNFDVLAPSMTADQQRAVCAVLFMSDEVPDEAHMERYRALAAQFGLVQ